MNGKFETTRRAPPSPVRVGKTLLSTPPATAEIVFGGDQGWLTEEAVLQDSRAGPGRHAVSGTSRTIEPDLQRSIADRMGTHAISPEASHSSPVPMRPRLQISSKQ